MSKFNQKLFFYVSPLCPRTFPVFLFSAASVGSGSGLLKKEDLAPIESTDGRNQKNLFIILIILS
jgi:hypothetical protein